MKIQRHTNHHGIQVMRMQQITTASLVSSVTIWAVHFWPSSPSMAIGGSLIFLFAYSGVLAVEFLASAKVNRHEPTPIANRQEWLKAWWGETCLAPQIFCWRQPFRAHQVRDELIGKHLVGQRGVVFVHGLICNRGFWTPWLKRLNDKSHMSHAFIAITLEPVFGSIDAYGDQIAMAVQLVTKATGQPPILVCHSMGGLAVRAWLVRQPTFTCVHHVVTIGTPHHGTWLARFALGVNGRQMRQGSDWLRQLETPSTDTGLKPPNQPQSQQASELFTCWYSNCDNIVFPASTAMLSGADNRFVQGAAHLQLAFMPEVMDTTLDMIIRGSKTDESL